MLRPHCRLLAPLLAAALLAACRGEDAPTPLTQLLIPPESRALVVVRPEPYDPGSLLSVDAAGTVEPVGRVGEGIRARIGAEVWGPDDLIRNPVAGGLVAVSDDVFVLLFGGADDPRNPEWAPYFKGAAVVSRDGTLTTLSAFPSDPASWENPPQLRSDAAGRLYFAALDRPFPGVADVDVSPLELRDGLLTSGWPLSAAVDDVTSFTIDDAGNLAYRAIRKEGTTETPILALRPTLGPLVTWPDAGDLGEPFRAADGKLYVTRALGDAAGTIELLRVDFALETVATPVASWAGAPGLLVGEPIDLRGARAFVRADEIVVLGADGTPAVHPLAFAHRAARASAGALWFVADAAGEPRRLVRWLDGVAEDLLPADAYDVEEIAPYDDAAALVGVVRRSDGERLILRAAAGGAIEPVETGIAQPILADGLRLRLPDGRDPLQH
jgi:hypothetical protein